MTLGSGAHTYQWISNWPKLPQGKAFGYTHGVVIDSNQNVHIFNQSADALCTFDREGNFLRSWGPEFAKGAHGLYLTKEGSTEFLYLCDYEIQKVQKRTLTGELVLDIPMPPRPDIYKDPKTYKPTDTCVAPNGDIYVFDGYGQPYIHHHDKSGKYLQSIGGPGKEPGQLNCPHAGNIDLRHAQPELYVADRGNNRIQVFTLDGKHKRFITNDQQMPCNFAWYKDEVYIPDLLARITILDKNDKLIAHLGENAEAPKTEGWPNIQPKLQEGKFNSPHQCRVNPITGDIFVVEWISTGRVTKLRRL